MKFEVEKKISSHHDPSLIKWKLHTVAIIMNALSLVVFFFFFFSIQIRIVTNISLKQIPDYPSDLLAIRFASWNQILDPWIYIVLRKEMLARLYNVYRRFNRQEASEYSVCNVDRSEVNDNGDMRNRLNTAQDETHQQVLTQSSKETGNVLSPNWN